MTPATQKVGSSGSAGTMLPGVKARVVKADGTLAKVGERGELVVSSPSNALRYHRNNKAYVHCILHHIVCLICYFRTEETFLPDG